MRLKLSIRRILQVLITVFIAAGLYNRLMVTEYTVHSAKVGTGIRIVLLSDLHSCAYGEAQSQLIGAIEQQHPDMVLLAGDMFDDVMPDQPVWELLEGIAGRYPCYYVSGNHEIWSGRSAGQKVRLASLGVTVLEGSYDIMTVRGQEIVICGVDDPSGGATQFQQQLDDLGAAIREDCFTVLLTHRPELLPTYAAYGFDLAVAGHAHGGQWRIPYLLPDGLLSPNQGYHPQYTRGVHLLNDTQMVVSRGLSRESTRIPRFYNRPEIVVIQVIP